MAQVNETIRNIENKITDNTVLFFDLDETLINTNLAIIKIAN